jgi:hypothetical protein
VAKVLRELQVYRNGKLYVAMGTGLRLAVVVLGAIEIYTSSPSEPISNLFKAKTKRKSKPNPHIAYRNAPFMKPQHIAVIDIHHASHYRRQNQTNINQFTLLRCRAQIEDSVTALLLRSLGLQIF